MCLPSGVNAIAPHPTIVSPKGSDDCEGSSIPDSDDAILRRCNNFRGVRTVRNAIDITWPLTKREERPARVSVPDSSGAFAILKCGSDSPGIGTEHQISCSVTFFNVEYWSQVRSSELHLDEVCTPDRRRG